MIHNHQFIVIAPNITHQSEKELIIYFQNTSILTVTFLPPLKKIKRQQFFAQPRQKQQLNFATDNFRGWGNWVELRADTWGVCQHLVHAHTQWYMMVHADVLSVGLVKVPDVKGHFKGYLDMHLPEQTINYQSENSGVGGLVWVITKVSSILFLVNPCIQLLIYKSIFLLKRINIIIIIIIIIIQ